MVSKKMPLRQIGGVLVNTKNKNKIKERKDVYKQSGI